MHDLSTHRRSEAGGLHRALTKPASKRPRRAAVLLAVGGLVIAGNALAMAETPPLGPGNIEIFNKRDMVALEGYTAQAGETATVTVSRAGEQVGVGEGVIDANGFLEFNHPGGECWIGVTPNITGGDVVSVKFSTSALTDSAVTGTGVITQVVKSELAATPDVPDDVEGTVTIRGTYGPDVDPSRFVVEIINPESSHGKTPPGEEPGLLDARAIGWVPVEDPTHPNGEPGKFTAQGTFANGAFEAVFGFYSAIDQERSYEGDHVAMSWMADRAGDLAAGATQYEFEEMDGPGFGGCPAGPGAQPPVGPTTATLTPAVDSLSVSWTAPAQPADATPISAYRVSARDGRFGDQEHAVRTSGTTAVLRGLAGNTAHQVFIEAFNGQWSAPVAVGSATTGEPAVTPPPGEEPPPGEATAPAAVSGLTATPTAPDTATVSWTAPPAAQNVTGYTVTATPTEGAATTVEVAAPATSATLTGLVSGAAYEVSVVARNAVGDGPAATASLTMPSAQAPGSPTVTRVQPGHESATLEWRPAQPGNAFSPVTGYDLVATPDGGTAITASVGAVTSGQLTGLVNGTSYSVEVFARSGELRGAAGTFGSGVPTTVTPNDQLTIGRAQYRADRREWRVSGTAQDVTDNTVTLRTTAGALIAANVPVGADGAWTSSVRNGPVPSTDNKVTATSSSGGRVTATLSTR